MSRIKLYQHKARTTRTSGVVVGFVSVVRGRHLRVENAGEQNAEEAPLVLSCCKVRQRHDNYQEKGDMQCVFRAVK